MDAELTVAENTRTHKRAHSALTKQSGTGAYLSPQGCLQTLILQIVFRVMKVDRF